MPIIQDILQFYFSPITMRNSAQNIIPNTLCLQIDNRIDKLQKIMDKVGESTFIFKGENLIPHVFKKFKSSLISLNVKFERKELRTLTYGLNYSEQNLESVFNNELELKLALNLLETEWRGFFLLGLIDCLLSNWDAKHQKSFEQLERFIIKKLETYNGNQCSILSLKHNKDFYSKSKSGDQILGVTLAKLKKPIQEATKILNVPESWFAYPYFSKVIVSYYEKNKNNIANEIDNLNDVLQKHNNFNTKKRLIPKIIIQANIAEFTAIQDEIKSIAFKQIGDPSNTTNWTWTASENADEIEKSEIAQARNILEEWIAKQFIDVFFRVCINDERRKIFWINIASKNKVTFKVYGSAKVKQQLGSYKNIVEYLNDRYEIVDSNRQISAFILYIADYMFIEFSDPGYAFYAYKIDGARRPKLTQKLKNVDLLRNGNIDMLVRRSGRSIISTNTEGRLVHNDVGLSWEEVFEYWFKYIPKINV